MEALLLVLVCIICILVCKRLSVYFKRLSIESQEKSERESFRKEALLASVRGIERALTPEQEPEPDALERLLRANEELVRKQNLKHSIEQELGVEM